MESWIDVVGYECLYKISNKGRVMKVATGKLLKTAKYAHGGYHKAELRNALNNIRREYVHRLVLEAFVGPCPEGMLCRHLDGDPTNNCVENLRWGTPKENSDDAVRHGTITPRVRLAPCTHKGPRRKLSEEQFAALMADRKNGMTQKAVAEKYGMSEMWVSFVECGRIKHRGEPTVPEGYREPLPILYHLRKRSKSVPVKPVPDTDGTA